MASHRIFSIPRGMSKSIFREAFALPETTSFTHKKVNCDEKNIREYILVTNDVNYLRNCLPLIHSRLSVLMKAQQGIFTTSLYKGDPTHTHLFGGIKRHHEYNYGFLSDYGFSNADSFANIHFKFNPYANRKEFGQRDAIIGKICKAWLHYDVMNVLMNSAEITDKMSEHLRHLQSNASTADNETKALIKMSGLIK